MCALYFYFFSTFENQRWLFEHRTVSKGKKNVILVVRVYLRIRKIPRLSKWQTLFISMTLDYSLRHSKFKIPDISWSKIMVYKLSLFKIQKARLLIILH